MNETTPAYIDVLVLEFANRGSEHLTHIMHKIVIEGGPEAEKAIKLLALYSQA